MQFQMKLMSVFATILLAAACASAQTTPTPVAAAQAIYVNGINLPSDNLTAYAGQSVVVEFGVTTSLGTEVINLYSTQPVPSVPPSTIASISLPVPTMSGVVQVPLSVRASSRTAKGGYTVSCGYAQTRCEVFSNEPGVVAMTISAISNMMGQPGPMYRQIIINFLPQPTSAEFEAPLLIIPSTNQASVGETATLTAVFPTGFRNGDYYLQGSSMNGGSNQQNSLSLGKSIRPGQSVTLASREVRPFEQGGWMYYGVSMWDQNGGRTLARGQGYANIKGVYSRPFEAKVDDSGNIVFTMERGNRFANYRAFLYKNGFCLELPNLIPYAKGDGVELVFYRDTMWFPVAFTAGDYTPIIIEKVGDAYLTHALPNGIHLGNDNKYIPGPDGQ